MDHSSTNNKCGHYIDKNFSCKLVISSHYLHLIKRQVWLLWHCKIRQEFLYLNAFLKAPKIL